MQPFGQQPYLPLEAPVPPPPSSSQMDVTTAGDFKPPSSMQYSLPIGRGSGHGMDNGNGGDRSDDDDGDGNGDANERYLAAKRARIAHACEPCRRKRIRCTGGDPCPQCQQGNVSCFYGEHKKRGPKPGTKRTVQRSPAGGPKASASSATAAGSSSSTTAAATTASSARRSMSDGSQLQPQDQQQQHQHQYPSAAAGTPPSTIPSPSGPAGPNTVPWTIPAVPGAPAHAQHHHRHHHHRHHHRHTSASSSVSISPSTGAIGGPMMMPGSHAVTAAGIPRSFSPHPAMSSPSATLATATKLSRDEMDELASNLAIHVSLDEHGRAQGLYTMGESSGFHLYHKISQRANAVGRRRRARPPPGATNPYGGGYVDRIYHVIERLGEPRNFGRFLRTWIGITQRALVTMLVDYYYVELHHWYPFVPRVQTEDELARLDAFIAASRDGISQPLDSNGLPVMRPSPLLINSFFFYTAAMFERQFCLVAEHSGGPAAPEGTPRFLLSRAFCFRAKQHLALHLENHLTSLETVQSCMLLSMADLPNVASHPWLLSGLSIRLAIELGIHQISTFLYPRDGASALPVPSHITTYAKTWVCCYALEQVFSTSHGRPSLSSSGDVTLDFDLVLDTPENRARFPSSELEREDAVFIWAARLADISGKISRIINQYYFRRNLQHTLPELHGLLSEFQASLPPTLAYDLSAVVAGVDSPRPPLAVAFLHISYYSAVLSLYRPFLASRRLRSDGLLQEQYLSIVEQCILAIPMIYLRHVDQAGSYPLDPSQFVIYVLTGCLAILEESQPSLYPNSADVPAASPQHARRRATVLSVLKMCEAMLDSIALHLPEYVSVLRLLCREFIGQVESDTDPSNERRADEDEEAERTARMEDDAVAMTTRLVDAEAVAIAVCGGDNVDMDLAEVGIAARTLEAAMRESALFAPTSMKPPSRPPSRPASRQQQQPQFQQPLAQPASAIFAPYGGQAQHAQPIPSTLPMDHGLVGTAQLGGSLFPAPTRPPATTPPVPGLVGLAHQHHQTSLGFLTGQQDNSQLMSLLAGVGPMQATTSGTGQQSMFNPAALTLSGMGAPPMPAGAAAAAGLPGGMPFMWPIDPSTATFDFGQPLALPSFPSELSTNTVNHGALGPEFAAAQASVAHLFGTATATPGFAGGQHLAAAAMAGISPGQAMMGGTASSVLGMPHGVGQFTGYPPLWGSDPSATGGGGGGGGGGATSQRQ